MEVGRQVSERLLMVSMKVVEELVVEKNEDDEEWVCKGESREVGD